MIRPGLPGSDRPRPRLLLMGACLSGLLLWISADPGSRKDLSPDLRPASDPLPPVEAAELRTPDAPVVPRGTLDPATTTLGPAPEDRTRRLLSELTRILAEEPVPLAQWDDRLQALSHGVTPEPPSAEASPDRVLAWAELARRRGVRTAPPAVLASLRHLASGSRRDLALLARSSLAALGGPAAQAPLLSDLWFGDEPRARDAARALRSASDPGLAWTLLEGCDYGSGARTLLTLDAVTALAAGTDTAPAVRDALGEVLARPDLDPLVRRRLLAGVAELAGDEHDFLLEDTVLDATRPAEERELAGRLLLPSAWSAALAQGPPDLQDGGEGALAWAAFVERGGREHHAAGALARDVLASLQESEDESLRRRALRLAPLR